MFVREVRDMASDAIAAAKKRRAAGDRSGDMRMELSNGQYRIVLTGNVAKGKRDSGTDYEGLMQVMADELENTSEVRVNCINPGATNTAMRRAAYPAETPEDNPTPEEIMGVYLYLMGEDSADITGASFDAQA